MPMNPVEQAPDESDRERHSQGQQSALIEADDADERAAKPAMIASWETDRITQVAARWAFVMTKG
jgi:hypothetical protein